MRLLRLQLFAAVLVIGMSAVGTLSAPAAATKKKPTATKSSKTRESSQSKSAKSKKVQPQAKNSRARRTQSHPATPQLASQSRSSSQAADVTSPRKGKKGFAVSNAATPKTPASPTTTTLNTPKPTAVVAPITAPAVNQGSASSTLILKSESSAPVRPASEPVQSSAAPTVPVPSNQPDRLEVIEYRDTQKNSAGPRSPPPSQSRGFGISNRRIEVEIDTPRVIQIQKALKDRGFYTLDPTGIYDEDTINAMRAFQESERIDITGYPTAHALKRLGL